jgi:hypothetical protein
MKEGSFWAHSLAKKALRDHGKRANERKVLKTPQHPVISFAACCGFLMQCRLTDTYVLPAIAASLQASHQQARSAVIRVLPRDPLLPTSGKVVGRCRFSFTRRN